MRLEPLVCFCFLFIYSQLTIFTNRVLTEWEREPRQHQGLARCGNGSNGHTTNTGFRTLNCTKRMRTATTTVAWEVMTRRPPSQRVFFHITSELLPPPGPHYHLDTPPPLLPLSLEGFLLKFYIIFGRQLPTPL